MTYQVLSIFGTRPEAIKMAPLVKALEEDARFTSKVLVTAQHREMLDQILACFAITPDYDLNIMEPGQTLSGVTAKALKGIEEVLKVDRPDIVLVHGDTTTTFVGSLAAFYQQVKCGHIEAGLRTDCKYAPFPEEMNRRLTGVLADYHFAPTLTAREHLLKENISNDNIVVTGNTVIDALLSVVEKDVDLAAFGLGQVDWQKKVILMTCHRRENWGAPMEEIFAAVADVVKENPDAEVILPCHKNPLVREIDYRNLQALERVHLVEPLDYLPFAKVMSKCYLVLTDSGGLQEEAPALGKPVLVLRDVTERPEAIAAGTARLAGTKREEVRIMVNELLQNEIVYEQMAHAANPYGDGTASRRTVEALYAFLSRDNK